MLSRPRHLGVGVSGPADGNDARRFITVMTRNLDEGTDFTPFAVRDLAHEAQLVLQGALADRVARSC